MTRNIELENSMNEINKDTLLTNNSCGGMRLECISMRDHEFRCEKLKYIQQNYPSIYKKEKIKDNKSTYLIPLK